MYQYDPYSHFIVIPLRLTLEYTEKAITNNIVTNVGHYLDMTLYRNLTNCLGEVECWCLGYPGATTMVS